MKRALLAVLALGAFIVENRLRLRRLGALLPSAHRRPRHSRHAAAARPRPGPPCPRAARPGRPPPVRGASRHLRSALPAHAGALLPRVAGRPAALAAVGDARARLLREHRLRRAGGHVSDESARVASLAGVLTTAKFVGYAACLAALLSMAAGSTI